MKNNNRFLLILVLVLGLVSGNATAALIDRGGGLIYDTDQNITWLQDANLAASQTFSVSDINPAGYMDWYVAQRWIAAMNADNYLGFSNWRLPTSDYCEGYNCTGSEMGHLFYTEMGGAAEQDISTTHNANYNLFQNVQSSSYWSGTDSPINRYSAYVFNFDRGNQGAGGIQNKNRMAAYAWAVRPGDVASVPIPAAFWLFGSGMLGLIGFAGKKAA